LRREPSFTRCSYDRFGPEANIRGHSPGIKMTAVFATGLIQGSVNPAPRCTIHTSAIRAANDAASRRTSRP
jgi:hypothetical protein